MSIRLTTSGLLAVVLLAFAGSAARAQVSLPGTGLPMQTPVIPGGIPSGLPIGGELRDRLRDGASALLQAPARVRDLIRRSDGALEADPDGWPVVRAEIVAIDLSPAARQAAIDAGFTVLREERLDGLDIATTVLNPPRGLSLRRALERLRSLAPDSGFTFNHVYSPAGGSVGAARIAPVGPAPEPMAVRVGLIDTGVATGHPALAGATVRQQGFAGPARVGAHGTAVASLLLDGATGLTHAAPGSVLFVADVYGGSPAGGSSTALAQALAWMVRNEAPVVNISLVGPRNALVEAAVRQAQARGVIIVAAVGNDGPAAPPRFPAAYPGVVGVTAVNGRGRVLPESGRGPQVDFAAPGADMAAAGEGQGYVSVRGSSFAAPLVAGLLAQGADRPSTAAAAAAIETLGGAARDLGARGTDPVYGRGLVAADRAVAPAAVGARGSLSR